MSDELEKQSSVSDDSQMSVAEHINELRRRLTRTVILLAVGFIVAFIFKDFLTGILFGPSNPEFLSNRAFAWLADQTGVDMLRINQSNPELINTQMAGQFKLHLKLSFVASLVVTIPFALWQLWIFVRPALTQKVIRHCRSLVFEVSLWFFVGLLFGYFIVAPLANNFLSNYVLSTEINNMIDVNSYLSIVLGVSMACALTFQLPLLIKLLATIGIVSSKLLRKYRKIAFTVILILSAVITPPDVFSQILVGAPLYILYEYGIVITRRIEHKRAAKEHYN